MPAPPPPPVTGAGGCSGIGVGDTGIVGVEVPGVVEIGVVDDVGGRPIGGCDGSDGGRLGPPPVCPLIWLTMIERTAVTAWSRPTTTCMSCPCISGVS